MRPRRISFAGILIGGCVATVAAGTASAQTYPSQTVRMIVPFAPGGLNDTTARLLQPHLEKGLGQTVIVDNRPAASGIVGTDAVAKAAPDGHSLLVVASSHAVVPATNPKVPYNIEKDLAAIVLVSKNPFFFVVNSKVPAKTLQEFVTLAKKEPDKYNYSKSRRRRAQSSCHRPVQPTCWHHASACAVSRRGTGDPVVDCGRHALRGDLAARIAAAYESGHCPRTRGRWARTRSAIS